MPLKRWFGALAGLVLVACSERPAASQPPDAGHDAADAPAHGEGHAADAETEDVSAPAHDAALEAAPVDQSDVGPDDAAPDADAAPDSAPPVALGALVEAGVVRSLQAPRPAYGALLIASQGERSYQLESRRDAESGPLGIPWRTRFRVAAYAAGTLQWTFDAEPDDVIGDVVVHPSGDLTLAIERFAPTRDAYELVRLSAAGEVRKRTTLAAPSTIPASDYGPADPKPLLRRKSPFSDATAAGWLRLLADGEGLVLAIMSYLDVPADDPRTVRRGLALEVLDWTGDAYVERWARVVEGAHAADPAAWAYDELRWREQAVRPFLARDAVRGELWVGRAWNQSRCQANRATFMEFPAEECVLGAANVSENERLPLAVTRFAADGTRLGTRILRPDASAAEQVPFALAVRDGELALAGSVVRKLSEDTKKTYPDANGYVDYDGYLAIYSAEGAPLRQHDFNLGRGDVLVALHWDARGIVAVGSSDWDRWQGGMSISRGANPLFVWWSQDGSEQRQRVVPLSDGSRHYNLHDVAVRDDAIVGVGFSDAPMTHSADGVGSVARSFGPLQVLLAP